MTQVLNEREAAEYIGMSPSFLRQSRCKSGRVNGPAWIKPTDRAVRYRIADLDAWLSQCYPSTAEGLPVRVAQ